MDENKINSELEETDQVIKENQPQEPAAEEPEKEQAEDTKQEKGEKKIRNQAFLRRGSFSLAITAVVLAGIIVLNILVGALSKRVSLEFDMTPEKKHSISKENTEYLKNLKQEVTITVCAEEDGYVSYMEYVYNDYFSSDPSAYFEQTITLLGKYPLSSDKITLRYIDTQTTEFMKIKQDHASEQVGYGSIIVSAGEGEQQSYKILNFEDIYQLSENSYNYEITGNNLETALTGAIAFVAGGKTRNIAILTGHSSENDFVSVYEELLKYNSYEVSIIEDSILQSIPETLDAVAIIAPTKDFIESELNTLSNFLNNDGKRNKSLLYFGDATAPYLKNFSDFLAEWGISLGEGVLFETDEEKHLAQDPTTIIMPCAEEHTDMGGGAKVSLIKSSVPILTSADVSKSVTTDILVQTSETTVAAPVGVEENWKASDEYEKQSYCGALRTEILDYNDENEPIKSQVFAFSSTDFLNPVYSYYNYNVANLNVVLACSELAVGGDETGVYFTPKSIANTGFTQPTESASKMMQRIFMLLIPLLVLAAGVVIYIRRRNAR